MTTKTKAIKEIAELREKIETLEAAVKSMPDDVIRGKPKDGDWYWFLGSTGDVLSHVWENDECDKDLLAIGNVYLTKELAEKARDRRKLIVELNNETDFVPDWGDDDEEKWCLAYDHKDQAWKLDFWSSSQISLGLPHFRTCDEAEAVIEKYGDRLNLLLEVGS